MKLKLLFILSALILPLGTTIHFNSSKTQPSKVTGVIKQNQSSVFLIQEPKLVSAEVQKSSVQPDQAIVEPQPSAPVDANGAKMFIYMHESGNNPTRANGSGCLGLGQACPGSKLLRVCPALDYACEDAFFTSYMAGRYGTWENAKAFWLAHNWW